MFLKSFFGEVGNPHPCNNCQGEDLLDFDVRMAFQPIVDSDTRAVYAYEALVRGMQGEGAGEVIGRVRPGQLYRFDQTCRVKAIATAAALGMQTRLSINFNPNAVYEPATCIRLTLAAAERCGFDAGRLIFEVTESERIRDTAHLVRIFNDYHRRGFMTAIDDFGAGYAGLNLLAEFQPDIVKLDMALIRDIDRHKVRRSIVAGIITTCRELGCEILAEGIESVAEYRTLRAMGVTLFQGYLFARPALESLPVVDDALWDRIETETEREAAGTAERARLRTTRAAGEQGRQARVWRSLPACLRRRPHVGQLGQQATLRSRKVTWHWRRQAALTHSVDRLRWIVRSGLRPVDCPR